MPENYEIKYCGRVYLLVDIDSDGQIDEIDEDDNTGVTEAFMKHCNKGTLYVFIFELMNTRVGFI